MKPEAVVLLSAGLDSSFNLWRATQDFKIGLALTFDYGQRAAIREIACAERLGKQLGVPHLVLNVRWFSQFSNSGLVGTNGTVPVGEMVKIDDLSRSLETAKSVWVPNRNGIFLNIAAGFAEGLGCQVIIPGFNAEEAATFPDNSAEFLRAMDQSLYFSTNGRVKTHCYTAEMSKSEIVREGIKLGLPFEKIWPCYFSEEKWCGQCESCQRFSRALSANGLSFDELKEKLG